MTQSKFTVGIRRDKKKKKEVIKGEIEEKKEKEEGMKEKQEDEERMSAFPVPLLGTFFLWNFLKIAPYGGCCCSLQLQPCPTSFQRNSCTGDHRDIVQWTAL